MPSKAGNSDTREERIMDVSTVLRRFGIGELNAGACTGPDRWLDCHGKILPVSTPIDGSHLASVRQADSADCKAVIEKAQAAFLQWRETPAPVRGQVIHCLGEKLRNAKEDLGRLVTIEMGKILPEGLGEVQEMIDVCDYAVGLSRQLHGFTMHSERPRHRMYEQYHPLGPVGVVSAFNFPVAVWSWNAAIAVVCGDPVIWKPSSKTPLTALAVQALCNEVAAENPAIVPDGLFTLVIGSGSTAGEALIHDHRVSLISATGSCRMGYRIAVACAARLGRSLLELGGNNAAIVLDDADPALVVPAVLFGAVGTAGQRCTTTRRLLVQKGIAETITEGLVHSYGQVRIGNPLEPGTLMGPVVDADTIAAYETALRRASEMGGQILYGGRRVAPKGLEGGYYVEPTLVRARADMPLLQEETFAPILYIVEIADVDEAIAVNNAVPQGLSSSIFTLNMRHAERFLSATGSDCGIANVNIGTSGAEIGGAFGGEKETGGGRESGSDAWKQYMRRQTNTINWSTELPLAQGIQFRVPQ